MFENNCCDISGQVVISNNSEYNSNFGMSPAQFHAGLDRLWSALELCGTQEKDVFTLAAEKIRGQREDIESLIRFIDQNT